MDSRHRFHHDMRYLAEVLGSSQSHHVGHYLTASLEDGEAQPTRYRLPLTKITASITDLPLMHVTMATNMTRHDKMLQAMTSMTRYDKA